MQPVQRSSITVGVALGVAYVLVAYFTLSWANALPTAAFLFVVPTAMGAATLIFRDPDQVKAFRDFIVIPWLTVLTAFVALYAVAREGTLCIAVLVGPFVLLGMLGTIVAWIIRALGIRDRNAKTGGMILMLLPLLVAGVEKLFLVEEEGASVASSVVIDAPPELVFAGLASVETIRASEYRPGLFHLLGVPRPIRATVDRAALGGKRTGYFEHGLRFDEVITAYDAPSRMSFDIAVDATTLREDSTERHALEGGYFRFEDATYTLAPAGPGRTTLTLTSRYVVATSVNGYGHLWGAAVVTDFQDRVLGVLKQRAERKLGGGSMPVAEAR